MAKIVNGILILRKANSTDWTPEIDAAMVDWTHQYIHWLETWLTAYQESMSPKSVYALNHAIFLFLAHLTGYT